jgi:CRP/FNR family transcriptional regulator, cyclic AMP receptor protein
VFIVNLFRNSERAVNLEPGHVVFQEGDKGDSMYIVLEGELEIRVKDKVIDTTGPGGIVGEMALIDNSPRSASCVAKTACKIVPVNERQFNFMVQETPNFAITVMRMMCDRLRRRFPAA